MSRAEDVSVVVPVRNTPVDIFDTCLTSIERAVERCSRDAEVIVVDDHSDLWIYEQYRTCIADRHSQIRHIRLAQQTGPGGARNAGIESSRARYICCVDADDSLVPDSLDVLTTVAEDGAVVVADHVQIEGGVRTEHEKARFVELYNGSNGDLDNPFLFVNFVVAPVLIPRLSIQAAGGYPNCTYSGEHVALWGQLFGREPQLELRHVAEVLYEYHLWEFSRSVQDRDSHIRGKSVEFVRLWGRLGLQADSFTSYVGEPGLPRLYVPVLPDANLYLPPWAELADDERWRFVACEE